MCQCHVLDHQMIPQRGTAAAHRSLGGWVKCAEQISHTQDVCLLALLFNSVNQIAPLKFM